MHSAWIAFAALVLFLLGTGVLLLGIVLAALAFRTAHQGIQYEVQQTCELGKYR